MVKVSIVIPTYNERENIQKLLSRIFSIFKKEKIDGEVIIVDDNSPDGTALFIKNFMKKNKKLRLLVRPRKLGLSSAVVDGFKIARGEILGVMDADLSHPPESIPRLLKQVDEAGFVLGSRYIKGGKILGWTFFRKIVSKGATILAKLFTKAKDPMSGFFFIKKDVIKGVKLNPLGYKIALEIIAKGKYNKVVEVPYTFTNRKKGKSKLNKKEYLNYLRQCFDLLICKKVLNQFIRFCVIGGLGTIINLAALYALVEYAKFWYISAAVIAFIISVTNNFIGNKIWTFKDHSKTVFAQYAKFFVVSVVALAVNLLLLYASVEYLRLWYILAQFIAILITTIINFIGNKIWTFD